MAKTLKRLLATLLVLSMVMSVASMSLFASAAEDEPSYKFQAVISSELKDESVTSVIGTVYDDYTAELVLPNKAVNSSNMTVEVTMQNVGSLGVTDPRSYHLSLNTEVEAEINLPNALAILYQQLGHEGAEVDALFGFEGASINATVQSGSAEENVTYTLAGTPFDAETAEKVITGTPNSEVSARAAWALLAENFDTRVEGNDSRFTIKNGSWLQIGAEKAEFEVPEGDLVLDNLQNLDIDAVKALVKVTPTDDSALNFHLVTGTELAVGSSVATLNKDMDVTVSGVELPQDTAILSGLRDSIQDSGDGQGNGFTFASYNAHDMLYTIRRALEGYRQPDGWKILMKRAMECDNSWGKSANAYIKLYKDVLKD